MGSSTVLKAFLATCPYVFFTLAIPMNANQNNYHDGWPSEVGSMFPSGQHSHSSKPQESWNMFESHNHREASYLPSYPFTDHQVNMPVSTHPNQAPEYSSTAFENERNCWPSHDIRYDDDLPPISDDFDFDVLQQIDPPQQSHSSMSVSLGETERQGSGSAMLVSEKKKAPRRFPRWKSKGGWREHFGEDCGLIQDKLRAFTGRSRSAVNRALASHGTVEIGHDILSDNTERMGEAVRKLRMTMKNSIPPRRYLFFGGNTKNITNAYARHHTICVDAAAKHLNEHIDERTANLLSNEQTFAEGADLIYKKRRLHLTLPGQADGQASNGLNRGNQSAQVRHDHLESHENKPHGSDGNHSN